MKTNNKLKTLLVLTALSEMTNPKSPLGKALKTSLRAPKSSGPKPTNYKKMSSEDLAQRYRNYLAQKDSKYYAGEMRKIRMVLKSRGAGHEAHLDD